MGSFSVWHWLIVLLLALSYIVPFWKLFKRSGWPGAIGLLMIVPLLNIVLLWILAFKKWPTDA